MGIPGQNSLISVAQDMSRETDDHLESARAS